jgi:YVTN family beta-propeller protein
VAGRIALENSRYPHHVYLSTDKAQLLVAVPGVDYSDGHTHGHGDTAISGAVMVLDATTGRVIAARRIGVPNHNANMPASRREIWTAASETAGAVLVLDPSSLDTIQRIDVGKTPAEVTFSADGLLAFVANTGSASVSVVDVASRQVVKTIGVGASPVGAWGSGQRLYVDNEQDATLSMIDAKMLANVRTNVLGFVPAMIAVAPDGTVWIADPNNARVVLYDREADRKVGEVATGAGAHGVTFGRDGRMAYITNQVADTVTVVDVATLRVMKELRVGSKPNGLVFRPAK